MDNICPVLPVRDIVIFPHVVVPLFVGRVQSISALEAAMEKDKKIVLLTQKSVQNETPTFDDLYHAGVLSNVLQMLKLPDDTVKILIEGIERVSASDPINEGNFFSVHYEILQPTNEDASEIEAYRRAAIEQFENYSRLNRRISSDMLYAVKNMESINDLIDIIAAHLSLKIHDKQSLLAEPDTVKRIEKLLTFMEIEIDVINVEKKIRNRVKKQMEKSQKEYYLNEQIKAIQKELGGDPEGIPDEIGEFEEKAKKAKLPKEAQEKFNSELKKLKNTPMMSPEATVIRNYLDWLLDIPWRNKTKVKHDIKEAKKVLDQDHFGLNDVKERVLEFLAVQNRCGKVHGSILCLMGPPGVGKTSLAKSIARATGRN